MDRKDDYPFIYEAIRVINIFCLLIFNFFMILNVEYIASYFVILFYFWLFIILSIIEVKIVINQNENLSLLSQKKDVFFRIFYIFTIMNVIYHYIK
mgnify:CR=1 FL=1